MVELKGRLVEDFCAGGDFGLRQLELAVEGQAVIRDQLPSGEKALGDYPHVGSGLEYGLLGLGNRVPEIGPGFIEIEGLGALEAPDKLALAEVGEVFNALFTHSIEKNTPFWQRQSNALCTWPSYCPWGQTE